MLIESMTRQTSIDLLKRARVARLGYIHDGQPYIVPMLFAYDVDYLYSFSTEGQKIAGMRANPQVCVEVDDLVTTQQWETVIVLGRYEELPHTEEHETSRAHAYALLQRRPGVVGAWLCEDHRGRQGAPARKPVFSNPHRPHKRPPGTAGVKSATSS